MVPRLAVALLVVLAGCAGISGDPNPTGDTPSQVPTTDAHTPSPATETTRTTFTPLEVDEGNTFEYSELSATEKRVFDEATEHGARFVDGVPHNDSEYYDPDVARTFEDHEWVVRNETFYRVSTGEDLKPLYDVEAIEELPPENATVVSLPNVSAPSRNYVSRAIENGTYTVPLGEPYPDDVEYGDYVRYGNQTYEIHVGHGDLLVTVVRAEQWG